MPASTVDITAISRFKLAPSTLRVLTTFAGSTVRMSGPCVKRNPHLRHGFISRWRLVEMMRIFAFKRDT